MSSVICKFRIEADDYKRLQRIGEKKGMSLSDLMRELVNQLFRQIPDSEPSKSVDDEIEIDGDDGWHDHLEEELTGRKKIRIGCDTACDTACGTSVTQGVSYDDDDGGKY